MRIEFKYHGEPVPNDNIVYQFSAETWNATPPNVKRVLETLLESHQNLEKQIKKPDNLKEELQAFYIGLKKFLEGEEPSVTGSIYETTEWGYGELNENGFWEFPIPEKLAMLGKEIRRKRKLLERLFGIIVGIRGSFRKKELLNLIRKERENVDMSNLWKTE